MHIFLPDLESALGGGAGAEGFAISSITILDSPPAYDGDCLEISISVPSGEHRIVAWFRDFPDAGGVSLARYAENLSMTLRQRTGMFLKKKLQVRAGIRACSVVFTMSDSVRFAEVRIIKKGAPHDSAVRICFPFTVLGLISRDLCFAVDAESLEKGLVGYFREPSRLFPDLDVLMDVFDDRELQELLYQLQKNRILTTYQLCLMVAAYPEHALKVKRCISANSARDVTGMMANLTKKNAITRRDLAEGIYSVEEAVYSLMVRGADFRYAAFLRDHQAMVTALSNMESLLRLDFTSWLERMEEDSLLYHALAVAGEREIARAIPEGNVRGNILLEMNISARRAAEVRELAKVPCSVEDRLAAQSRIVSIYRNLRIRKRNWGAESFEYLLRCVTHPHDFRRLLAEAGWFTLSTALKGANPSLVKKVTENLPAPARFLVEDVLRGVVNPNILHDEMQVDAARRRCVEAMCALEEKGVMALEARSGTG